MAINPAKSAVIIAAVVLLGAGLSGCSSTDSGGEGAGSGASSVSAVDLQKSLTDRLTDAGTTPQAVTCTDGLVREVGKTTTCDVVFSDTNSVRATLTATNVDGDSVDYDLAPSLTTEQLQAAVSGLASTPTVSCDSGLDGTVGATATCEVTVNGAASTQQISVSGVNGLAVDLDMTLIAPKAQLADMLKQRIAADSGTAPETVACVDDVLAKAGNTVECAVTAGGSDATYLLTVTTIEDNTIDFDYAAQP